MTTTTRGRFLTTSAAFSEPRLTPTVSGVTLALIAAVVLKSFLGSFSVTIAGFRVRAEHVVPMALVIWMLAVPSLRRPFARLWRHPVVATFAVFIAWNVVSTLLFSPNYVHSATILVWLIIDLLLLVAMMTWRQGAELADRLGRWSVIPWGLLGFVAFLIANLTRGAFTIGTDFDWLYQIYVARLTAIEANIYASILVFWTLVAITRRPLSRAMIIAIAVSVPLGLLASQTRTSVLSLLAGLAVYAIYTLARRSAPIGTRARMLIPVVVLVGTLLISYVGTSLIPSSSVAQAPEPGTTASHPAQTPTPTPSVPDPTNPDTQNKIGDLTLQGGTIGFRWTVAKLAAQEMHGINLLLGNGTNTFGLRHDQPGTPGITGNIIMLPVQILYDAGIVGLLLLIAIGVAIFLAAPRSRRPLVAGVLTAYVISATLTSMFWFSVTWILIAVSLLPERKHDALS